MAVYSIRDLEQITGIKAHTLRIWEQRYGLISPKRTPTNIRYYLDEDLRFLLNVALLNRNGIKISKIAEMSHDDISRQVATLSEASRKQDSLLDRLTLAMVEMDEEQFERLFNNSLEQQGFESTMTDIIIPFLDKLGLMWFTGSINPAQEHFISYLIRRKIIVAIDQLPPANQNAQSFLLYLPEGQSQELIMLFLHYLIRARGHKVLYLGHHIPFTDLQAVYTIKRPSHICTVITEAFQREPIQRYVQRLADAFPLSNILLSGYQVVAQPISVPEHVRILAYQQDIVQYLDNLGQPSPSSGQE